MLTFAQFHADDLKLVTPQAAQRDELAIVNMQIGAQLEKHLGWSVWEGEECICCSGIMPLHPHRGFVWALLGAGARRHMLPLTRFSRRVFDAYPARRLEVTVLPEFDMGIRWMKMLGFELEARLRAYDEIGRDMLMFARIK